MIVAMAFKNPRKMTPAEKARIAMDLIESTTPCSLSRGMMLAAVDFLSLARLTWKEKRKGKVDRCAMEWKSRMQIAD